MNEKIIERKLREKVKAFGGLALKFYSPSFTGMPDRIVLMPGGRIWFAEIKTTGKKLSPRQQVVKPILEKLGFQVWVIDDEAKLQNFLNQIA